MNERELIIEWLVGRPDDEAHPEFTRLVMEERGLTVYSDSVHAEICRRMEGFRGLFEFPKEMTQRALREFYNAQTPQSLLECFDGWCCHQYR